MKLLAVCLALILSGCAMSAQEVDRDIKACSNQHGRVDISADKMGTVYRVRCKQEYK